MTFVEIPLNKFVYRFRRLTWREELQMKFVPKDDQRRVVLATALHNVSGLALSRSDARKAVQALPEAVLWRVWVLYRADLPADRYYTSGGLYAAPDPNTHRAQIEVEERRADAVTDRAMAEVERQFGGKGVTDAMDISQRMFEQARREGRLQPARGGVDG